MNNEFRISQFTEFIKLLREGMPQGYKPHLFRCAQQGKNPATQGSWKDEKNVLTEEQAITAIKQGYNIGIAGTDTDALVIIDIDKSDLLKEIPTNTLVNTSRKRAGAHIFCYDTTGELKQNKPFNFGEIRTNYQYVLAAGSYVPFSDKDLEKQVAAGEISEEYAKKIRDDKHRGYYTVQIRKPPREFTFKDIPETFQKAIKEQERKDREARERVKQREEEKKHYAPREYANDDDSDELKQLLKLKIADVTKIYPPEQRTGHPLHSSDTDANWSVDEERNLGCCWRHNVTLNPYQFLVVKSGYAECEDAGTPMKNNKDADEERVSRIKADGKAVQAAIKEAKKQGLITSQKRSKKTEKKEEIIHTSSLITEEKIYEQVHQDNKPLFAAYDVLKQTVSYVTQAMDEEGNIYAPIYDDAVKKRFVGLPSKATEYESDKALREEIKAFINKWLDIQDELTLQLLVYNIIKSWAYERFHTLNYPRALGEHGTGKSRYLDVIGGAHYKPISTSGALTSAVLFRIINHWKGTIIIDEADQARSDESQDIIKILNQGYEKNRPVMRCDPNSLKVEFFDVYCPKVIATRKTFTDKALESRCITNVMRVTTRKDIPPNINEDFYEELTELRNKLLMWRFKNYHAIDPRAGENIDLGNIEPRLRQVSTGFVSMFVHDEEALKQFKQFLAGYQEQLVEERTQTYEGRLVEAFIKLRTEGQVHISASMLVEKAELTDKKGNVWNGRRVAPIMKTLGFEAAEQVRPGKGEQKIRAYPYTDEMLIELAKRWISDKELIQEFKKNCTAVPVASAVPEGGSASESDSVQITNNKNTTPSDTREANGTKVQKKQAEYVHCEHGNFVSDCLHCEKEMLPQELDEKGEYEGEPSL